MRRWDYSLRRNSCFSTVCRLSPILRVELDRKNPIVATCSAGKPKQMKLVANSTGNIEGLQILRAVAALMVVFHHARYSVLGSDGWPTFGETGVDIFFVISGFVMSFTTAQFESSARIKQRLRDAGVFIRKRIIRVVPLYWLALLWTSRRDLSHGNFSFDLLADFLFLPHPNAEFPRSLAPTLQQGWTLNYEAFFYLMFAASILFGTRRFKILVCTLAGLVIMGSLLARVGWPAQIDSPVGIARRFYGDSIILEFGFGVLVERLIFTKLAFEWPRWTPVAIGTSAFIALAVGHGVSPRGLMQGLPAALIVWAGVHVWAGKRSPILELLGAASYSIYLFHWASFGAVKPLTAALSSWPQSTAKVTVLILVHFVVALIAGLAIHIAIEKPLMRWAIRKFGGGTAKVPAVLSA